MLDPVVMSRDPRESGISGMSASASEAAACEDHDFDRMRPLVLATWKHGFQVRSSTTQFRVDTIQRIVN